MTPKPLTIADATPAEIEVAHQAWMTRYGQTEYGRMGDGWGRFTLEHQGPGEIDRLLKWARERVGRKHRQEEFAT